MEPSRHPVFLSMKFDVLQVDLLWDERAGQWSSLAEARAGREGAVQAKMIMQTCNLLVEGGATAEAEAVRLALQAGGRCQEHSSAK